jgi:VCBS repeat-containing protein
VGAALTGTYGSLTLNANGSYTYVVTESNPTVEALRAGQSLNEVFTYTVQDAGGLTDTAQLTITINGANDFPVARADTHFVIDGVSDALGNVLVSANHGGVFADQADIDVEADTLTVVKVNGSAGNVGVARAVTYGTITLAADGSYRYVLDVNNATVQALPPDHTLVETVTYQVSDGQGGTADTTLSITIYGRNNEPTGANHTIVATEDTLLVVHTADFGFADVDSTTPANAFAGVRIDTLPATGTLSLNGVAVTAGQLISKADLDAGKLSYLAPHDVASLPGQALTSFAFSVRDGLGAYDLTSRTMSVEVTQVSDAPDLVTATADGSNNQPNQPIPLSISIALTDTNGPAPETLGPVTISGLPGGVTLSNNAGDVLTIVNGSIT